jgi:uncharacterized membrane protein (UPF0127 family)
MPKYYQPWRTPGAFWGLLMAIACVAFIWWRQEAPDAEQRMREARQSAATLWAATRQFFSVTPSGRLPCITNIRLLRYNRTPVVMRVEVARTADEQMKGLMHRHHLASNEGMLFDFGGRRDVAMWMKNTPLPLDMLFIDSNGAILQISGAAPNSLDIIRSSAPVRYVLEIARGEAEAQGIKLDDTLELPLNLKACR